MINALRTLFTSPSSTKDRPAREQQHEEGSLDDDNNDNGDDNNVFPSPFGDDIATQPPDGTTKSNNKHDEENNVDEIRLQQLEEGDGGRDVNGEMEEEEDLHQHGESLESSAGQQSLATQMTNTTPAGSPANNNNNDQGRMMVENEQEVTEPPSAAAGGSSDEPNATSTLADQEQSDLNAGYSPLTNFFAHTITTTTTTTTDEEDHQNNTTLAHRAYNNQKKSNSTSLEQWRKARKSFLIPYLTHRLIGMNEEEGDEEEEEINSTDQQDESNDKQCGKGGDEEECCSFTSEIMDDPFSQDDSQLNNVGIHNSINDNQQQHDDDSGEEDEEGDEEDMLLETQPQTAPAFPTSSTKKQSQGSSSQEQEEEEESEPISSSLKTQEESLSSEQQQQHNLTPTKRLLTGIKRTLGWSVEKEDEQQEEEEEQPAKKKSRTNQQQHRSQTHHHVHVPTTPRKRKGLVWDGIYKSITRIADTSSSCIKLCDLDLNSSSLNLSLCHVLRVCEFRLTKRMDKVEKAMKLHYEGSVENEDEEDDDDDAEVHPHDVMVPFDHWEDDGPLNTIYKRVFSIEIDQLMDDADGGDNNETTTAAATTTMSPSVTNIANAAFYDGKCQLDKQASRKARHEVRRIKVFFYNEYADAMSDALDELRRQSLHKASNRKKSQKLLLSLKNVPPECILPYNISPPRIDSSLAQYVNNPYGDAELGSLSPYCVCIGDESAIKHGDEHNQRHVRFDSEELEVRVVEMPQQHNHTSVHGENEMLVDDAIISQELIERNIEGNARNGYVMEGTESTLVKRYVELTKREKNTAFAPGFALPPNEEEVAAADNDSRGGDNAAGERNAEDTPLITAGGATGQQSAPGQSTAEISRPQRVLPLCNLLQHLRRNGEVQKKGTKKLTKPGVDVYGVVLGFSPPKITKQREWMMTIVLIDETLPLSIQSQNHFNSTEQLRGNNSNPKEMHVPSTTLVIFSKDLRKLPVVRSAGDVIYCERVILQEYEGEAQLVTYSSRRTAKIIIARPHRTRRPDDREMLLTEMRPNDWAVSCSCHETDDEAHSTLNWQLINKLWKWGQHRLAAHPTMSPLCHLSIGEFGEHNNNGNNHSFEVPISGDLTAAVTAIIPWPEHSRGRATPRGYIRLWDGTGPSLSDPLPPGVAGVASSNNNNDPCDPPLPVLLEIEQITSNLSSSSSHSNNGAETTIQAPSALCGRVINAIIWEENLWTMICQERIVGVGSFVRLRNINSAKFNCISVHVKSYLVPLPFDTYEVKTLLKSHDSLVRRRAPYNSSSAILPARSSNQARSNIMQNPARLGVVQETIKNNGGYSTIKDCLQKPPPGTFECVHFEVSNLISRASNTRDLTIDSLQALCIKDKGFRFAFHIKDQSSEMDVICHGEAAENLLGIKVQDVIDKSKKCEEALATLKEILSGTICEGKISSKAGKDGKLYFILKSMFPISAGLSM